MENSRKKIDWQKLIGKRMKISKFIVDVTLIKIGYNYMRI